MNRRQRRAAPKHAQDFTPVAQQPAHKLAVRCPELDWPQRYVLFTAGVQQIASFCPGDRQGDLEGMIDTFARCVAKAFGAPAIGTPEQAAIWYRSNDSDYRRQAVDWLRDQGGRATIRRLDGLDISLDLDDASGEITGMLWPDAAGQA
jgi:hypothetical protein